MPLALLTSISLLCRGEHKEIILIQNKDKKNGVICRNQERCVGFSYAQAT